MVESNRFADAADAIKNMTSNCSYGSKLVGGTCAHLVCGALDKVGFPIKSPHDAIEARCPNMLPIRSKETAEWVKAIGI